MHVPKMRPRFFVPVDMTPEEALGRIKAQLTTDARVCQGKVVHKHVQLGVCERERTFWSPFMDFEIVELREGAVLEGKFGPHPDVWTLFVALYALEALLAIAGAMYGVAQLQLGRTAWALWALPVAGLLALLTYLSSFVGQALGRRQMHRLEQFLAESLDHEIIDSEPPRP